MPLYVPVIITAVEARQWTPDTDPRELAAWCGGLVYIGDRHGHTAPPWAMHTCITVKQHGGGGYRADPGDWIIHFQPGRFEVLGPVDFAALYRKMDDPAAGLRVNFGGGAHLPGRQEWGFWTKDLPAGFLPAPDLVGKTVNIGTKDGKVFGQATVSAFDAGFLTLDVGVTRALYEGAPAALFRTAKIHVHDIARGYVHETGSAALIAAAGVSGEDGGR